MENNATETKTLVALFDNYSSAQQAARELESVGISKDRVRIESNHATAGAGSTSGYASKEEGSGFGGWLNSLFGGESRDEYGHYDEAVRRGNTILTVQADQNYANAVAILNNNGAIDIDKRVDAWRADGYSGYNATSEAYTSNEAALERDNFRATAQAGTVPVIEEELQVGKRVVQSGGVRVYSHVIDQPVEEQVNLREERVRVERRPVNRPVTDAELGGLRDQTIEVTQMAEEAVVSKRARVVEEVVVGKESNQRTETVRDNVRRTEVTVDTLDADRTAGSADYSGYGERYRSDARFRDLTWDNAEQDIRSDYMRSNPGSNWDSVKDSIRSGWEKAKSKL